MVPIRLRTNPDSAPPPEETDVDNAASTFAWFKFNLQCNPANYSSQIIFSYEQKRLQKITYEQDEGVILQLWRRPLAHQQMDSWSSYDFPGKCYTCAETRMSPGKAQLLRFHEPQMLCDLQLQWSFAPACVNTCCCTTASAHRANKYYCTSD